MTLTDICLKDMMAKTDRHIESFKSMSRTVSRIDRGVDVLLAAIDIACEEIEGLMKEKRPCATYELSKGNCECDEDCGVCMRQYLITRGKERVEAEACAEEIEGRKRMDAQDQKRAGKEEMNREVK